MLDLATYYTVNKQVMESHVHFTVQSIGEYKEYCEQWPTPAYNFEKNYWSEIARQARGLPIIYDSFDEFWAEFKTWFDVRVYDYVKMLIAVHSEYNPIHNYDRTEDHTENVGKSGKKQMNGKERNQTTQNGKNISTTKTASTAEGEKTTTNKVNGYNGEEMTTRDIAESTNKESNTATGEDSAHFNSASDGYRHIDSLEVDKEESNRNSKIHSYGNIGVTTTQKMIESEIMLRRNHVITHMVSDFKKDFCIMVY